MCEVVVELYRNKLNVRIDAPYLSHSGLVNYAMKNVTAKIIHIVALYLTGMVNHTMKINNTDYKHYIRSYIYHGE